MDMHSAASAAAEGLLGVPELSSDTTAERGLTAIANQTDVRPQQSPRRGDACSGHHCRPRDQRPACLGSPSGPGSEETSSGTGFTRRTAMTSAKRPTRAIVFNGRERVGIEEVANYFVAAFPDGEIFMDELVFKEDSVEFHWTLTGTRAETGKRVRLSGYEEWTIGAERPDRGVTAQLRRDRIRTPASVRHQTGPLELRPGVIPEHWPSRGSHRPRRRVAVALGIKALRFLSALAAMRD